MSRRFTLEYWKDDGWFVGRLKEVPGVCSQGVTLVELEENIQDAFSLLMSEPMEATSTDVQVKDVELEV